jgi:segregation and condensation protein A
LRDRGFCEFRELFSIDQGVPMLVVNFLAMLELAREGLVQVTQAQPFAPIYVKLNDADDDRR